MKYTKEILDNFLEKVMQDRLSAEVALINYRNKLKEVVKEKEKTMKENSKVRKDLEELRQKKKEGFESKELREQNKEIIKVVEAKLNKYADEYAELLKHENNMKDKINLYEDFLETADESVEIAKKLVEK